MRLDRVYIDGFKNLKQLEVDFDERQLTTVIIGQNGAGKSNLIEALARIFRHVDLRDQNLRFNYRVQYRIQPRTAKAGDLACVVLSNVPSEEPITVNGKKVSRAEFERNKFDWFPDMVFGYYSGNGRRLEQIFDKHQANYYRTVASNEDEAACFDALQARRLFYCRPLHGVFALLTQMVFSDAPTRKLLQETVKIKDFHSALCLFHEPWYAKGGRQKKFEEAGDFWNAGGPAGRAARQLKEMAYYPFGLVGNSIQDYRDQKRDEVQFAVFLKDESALDQLREAFSDDADMFYALEAMDVSDLIRDFSIWVTRDTDESGDIEYSDLSDGERQLLMVMGLLRVARGKRVLFLLDEPDTHLNPHWQHSYLRLLEQWTDRVADADNCHIVLTSHNPLTISALTCDEVRIMYTDSSSGAVLAEPPFVDPRGLGIGGVLTDIFGMPSTLDQPTQDLIDARNRLARLAELDSEQIKALDIINEKLRELGFMYEERDELYRQFLRKIDAAEFGTSEPRSPSELRERDETMQKVIDMLLREKP